MIVTIFAIMAATSTTIADAIFMGVSLGAGIYCTSRTKKTSYMPKKAR